MSNKTNEEKLRILQERLTQIKQKKDTPSSPREKTEKATEVTHNENDVPKKEKNLISLGWLKYVAIFGSIGYIAFYAYNNISFNVFKSENTDTTESTEIDESKISLKYTLDLIGDNIAIVASFEDEGSAKAMVNDLKVKGFKSDYFFLPYKSNSIEEVYKVYIGPYENNEETNQWVENLESDTEIIAL